jgi:hypothetical protein
MKSRAHLRKEYPMTTNQSLNHGYPGLGQRVYGVDNHGEICVDLIKELYLSESGESDRFADSLSGKTFRSSILLNISYRTLGQSSQVFMTFDKAVTVAQGLLEQLLASDNITIAQQKKCQERLDSLKSNPGDMNSKLQSVNSFEGLNYLRLVAGNKSSHLIVESDFPKKYHYPGDEVWVADIENWRIIRGLVTKVSFAKNWSRKHLYYIGSHSNIDARRVFKTKRGALNYLTKMFKKNLPGTIDIARVKVVKYTTEAEQKKKNREVFTRMAENMHL